MNNEPAILAWHFLQEDRRLRYGEETLVTAGQSLKVEPPIIMCAHGLHASIKPLDALCYAPGPICCRVKLHGEINRGDDKLVATERTCLHIVDTTKELHLFACWCAIKALKLAKIEDPRSWEAIKTKIKWLQGEATDKQLSAARDAAYAAHAAHAVNSADAAAHAAWAAARAASWAAADAACAAAYAANVAYAADAAAYAANAAAYAANSAAYAANVAYAACAAARAADGDGDAARDAQNKRLSRVLWAAIRKDGYRGE